jgi:hypothetical protein
VDPQDRVAAGGLLAPSRDSATYELVTPRGVGEGDSQLEDRRGGVGVLVVALADADEQLVEIVRARAT